MARARVALVTGGAVRVGRAIAQALAGDSFHLAIHYHRSAGPAHDVVAHVERAGGRAVALQADLRDPDHCAALPARAADALGGLDVVVNSAASFFQNKVGSTTSERWDEIFALNVRAPFLITQASLPFFGDDACVVNIADLAGVQAWPSYSAHGAAKAALIHLTRTLARALGPRVRCNAIAPGAVMLPEDFSDAAAERLITQTPLGRLGSPDDVVRAVRYLVGATFVTGSLIVVDGGRNVR
jgi:pteridine reductase